MMKQTMKRALSMLLVVCMVLSMLPVGAWAAETEPEENTPEVYFDLEFVDGVPVDAMGNASVTQSSGEVGTKQVVFQNVLCEVPAYNAEKYVDGDHQYLDVAFDEITTGDEMGEWILGGITFECLIYVDTVPTKTVGFMCNLNEGGVGVLHPRRVIRT